MANGNTIDRTPVPHFSLTTTHYPYNPPSLSLIHSFTQYKIGLLLHTVW